jgi:hypothetical protein
MTLPKLTKLLDNPTVRDGFAAALAESDAPTPYTVDVSTPIISIVGANGLVVAEMGLEFAPETAQRIANLWATVLNAVAAMSAEAAP